ncbi:MAG: gluconate 2-dehydrogenase subunit 3 family protein [Arcobacteraceae bacterium]|nr:gluconate 2-dehydrogenase subunit 3 family protein [Arcobacteraceae bacterium]
MGRRNFIALALLLLTIPLTKDTATNSWEIIKSILEHIFPKYKNFIGAKEFQLTQFLHVVSSDKYFKKEDLKVLVDGSKKIYILKNEFTSLDSNQKEKILREFEQQEFGQKWLSMVMNYGIEGMFSDPIYGGNKSELGWKSIGHNSGLPRPKVKYGV